MQSYLLSYQSIENCKKFSEKIKSRKIDRFGRKIKKMAIIFSEYQEKYFDTFCSLGKEFSFDLYCCHDPKMLTRVMDSYTSRF